MRPARVRGITVERVANAVLQGYLKGKREVVVPWTMHPGDQDLSAFPWIGGMVDGAGWRDSVSSASCCHKRGSLPEKKQIPRRFAPRNDRLMPALLRFQFVQHGGHFRLRVTIAGAPR